MLPELKRDHCCRVPPALEAVARRIGWVKNFVGRLYFTQRHFLPNARGDKTADRTVLELVVYRLFAALIKGSVCSASASRRSALLVPLVIGPRVWQGALTYQGTCTRTVERAPNPSAKPPSEYPHSAFPHPSSNGPGWSLNW
jgi:hypothetical protein